MSDKLIKLSDAIKALRKRWARTISYDGIGEDIGEECEVVIKAVPSADRWIPCSERLPSEQGQYLVTFPLCNGEPWVHVLNFCKGKFYETDDEYGDVEYDDVIAWMPLPKPYEEEANDEADRR